MKKSGGPKNIRQNTSISSNRETDLRSGPRTSIAEALVKHSSILVINPMEESSIFPNKFAVEELILNQREMTVLSVNRKISKSLMEKYDKIFVKDQQSQVKEGTFNDLLMNNDYFHHLFVSNET